MFFQIHRDGQAVDGSSYSTLAEASSTLIKAEEGGHVAQVDGSDRIIRSYTLQECRKAARSFRHAVSAQT
jgi:hypothetical protein